MRFEEIDIEKYEGIIPVGSDLVIREKTNPEHCLVLYGFDEIYDFVSDFKNPIYGFLYWL